MRVRVRVSVRVRVRARPMRGIAWSTASCSKMSLGSAKEARKATSWSSVSMLMLAQEHSEDHTRE